MGLRRRRLRLLFLLLSMWKDRGRLEVILLFEGLVLVRR